jgi:hypothetical protein
MWHLTCCVSCWVASPMMYWQSIHPDCELLYCQNVLSSALLQEAVHTCRTCVFCWSHKATWPVDTTRGIPSGAAGNAGALGYFTSDIVYCCIWRYNYKSLYERLGSHSYVYVGSCLLGCTMCWSGNSYWCFGEPCCLNLQVQNSPVFIDWVEWTASELSHSQILFNKIRFLTTEI